MSNTRVELFDSHAHFDLKNKEPGTVEAMLERAWENGLVGIVAIAGAQKAGEWTQTLEIAKRERRIWVTAGVHPHAASYATPDVMDKLRFVLDNERIVALGEIGLDYHYNYSTPKEQRQALIRQIRIAHEVKKPIVVHTREADEDILSILKDEGADELGGVFHCFSSDLSFAKIALDMGFFISFSGVITFPKAKELRRVAQEIPIERILAETDTPFLTPIPYRGRPNEPAHVRYVVEKIAEIRQASLGETAGRIVENTKHCFGIDIQV